MSTIHFTIFVPARIKILKKGSRANLYKLKKKSGSLVICRHEQGILFHLTTFEKVNKRKTKTKARKDAHRKATSHRFQASTKPRNIFLPRPATDKIRVRHHETTGSERLPGPSTEGPFMVMYTASSRAEHWSPAERHQVSLPPKTDRQWDECCLHFPIKVTSSTVVQKSTSTKWLPSTARGTCGPRTRSERHRKIRCESRSTSNCYI